MSIQYLLDEGWDRGRRVQSGGQFFDALAFFQGVGQFTPLAVLQFFLLEPLEVMKARGIQQTQAGEVTGLPDLFWRGREQQQPGGLPRQRCNKKIVVACAVLRPVQVMGLVNGHQIPPCG